jgi:hypothetical protein
MIYRDQKGNATLSKNDHSNDLELAISRIQEGILAVEKHYDGIDPEQHSKLLAMASHLMAMLTEE